MSSLKLLIILITISIIMYVFTPNTEVAFAAKALGANTTALSLIDECDNKFNIPSTQKEQSIHFVNIGLQHNTDFFIAIDKQEMIQHASDNTESQLEEARHILDKFKCENLVKSIIRDKGIIEGSNIRDYYK